MPRRLLNGILEKTWLLWGAVREPRNVLLRVSRLKPSLNSERPEAPTLSLTVPAETPKVESPKPEIQTRFNLEPQTLTFTTLKRKTLTAGFFVDA